MTFKKDDLLRLPILVLFDALVASKFSWVWNLGTLNGSLISVAGIALSIFVFSCQTDIITQTYMLVTALAVHTVILWWNFAVVLNCHETFYNHTNTSLIVSVKDHVLFDTRITEFEKDFILKLSFCLIVIQSLNRVLSVLLQSPLTDGATWNLISTAPVISMLFDFSRTSMILIIFGCTLPSIYLWHEKFQKVRQHWVMTRQARQAPWAQDIENLLGRLNNAWTACRVPSVLRLYFFVKCIWGIAILVREPDLFSNESYSTSKKSGLYYFFHPDRAYSTDQIEFSTNTSDHSVTESTESNLTLYEGLTVILTDSLVSSFAVGSAISVLGFYAGVGLHNFVGGNDIMQGEALGMMSSVLFCLLAIQTGLSSLPPLKRVARLYRNSFLLGSAIMHFFLDVVHPVLMSISPQSHIPWKKHISPLLVCTVLLVLPAMLCHWLLMTKPISTWMVALVAFNMELLVKVLTTLLVYAMYIVDSRSHTGIIHIDDYVFWIRSTSHVIEFICGLVMFVNGGYILFFESSNLLRAIMMSMHAYVNIYRTFREGWKTLNNRRTVNKRIASLQLINIEEMNADDLDVCSICYQEFTLDIGEVRLTHCKHMFHSNCLRKWIFIQDSCPMCDRALFLVSENDEEKVK